MQTPKTLAALSIIAFSLVAGSAVAGPDWSIIERGRAVKQAEKAGSTAGADASSKQVNYAYGPRAPYIPPQHAPSNVAKSLPAKDIVADNATP